MDFAIVFTISAVLITITMVFIRIVNGPTIFDRFLGINSLNTKINLLLIILGSFMFNESFIDIAFIYALTGYISIYGVLRFIRNKNFGGEE